MTEEQVNKVRNTIKTLREQANAGTDAPPVVDVKEIAKMTKEQITELKKGAENLTDEQLRAAAARWRELNE
jgi:hypothetical protein